MNSNAKQPILALKQVSKIYTMAKGSKRGRNQNITALNNISFDIDQGEIFGIVGESGSGKTTIGRLIVKLEAPIKGDISFKSSDISLLKGKTLKNYRSQVQMIFQDPYQSLNPRKTIGQSIVEPLIIHRIGDRNEQMQRVNRYAESVGLPANAEFFDKFPHQLSGGQRQRVAIARAMIIKPEFVVADEPTSMLDASISVQIYNILQKFKAKRTLTFVFISHSLAAAKYLCDRIAVIYRGHLMEIGSTRQVIKHPVHPYTRALIDAIPSHKLGQAKKMYNTFLCPSRDLNDQDGCPFTANCRRADLATCTRQYPPLLEVSQNHGVACFFAHEIFTNR